MICGAICFNTEAIELNLVGPMLTSRQLLPITINPPTCYNVIPPFNTTVCLHNGPEVCIRFHPRRMRVGLCIIHAEGMPALSSSGAEDGNLFIEVLLKSWR